MSAFGAFADPRKQALCNLHKGEVKTGDRQKSEQHRGEHGHLDYRWIEPHGRPRQ
jgi:hypothetical protein